MKLSLASSLVSRALVLILGVLFVLAFAAALIGVFDNLGTQPVDSHVLYDAGFVGIVAQVLTTFLREVADPVAALAAVAGIYCLIRYQAQLALHKQLSENAAVSDPAADLPFQLSKLESVRADHQSVGLCLLGLDNLGQVNKSLGRTFGNAVVKEIAWRLESHANEKGGVVARCSGDRFGILLPLPENNTLESACRDLVALCECPILVGAHTMTGSVSVGAIRYAAKETDCGEAWQRASAALEASSAGGGGCYTIYNDDLQKQDRSRRALTQALAEAVRNHALEVHLQPRMSIKEKRVLGFEALVRWWHDERFVPATEIISIAEASGMIIDLDKYMVDLAVGTVADWNLRRKTRFPVSVNLSHEHFQIEDGLAFISDTLQRHRFPAELLTVEIAEAASVDQNSGFVGALERLRALGCRVSIDDFGTGFSSFTTLRNLQADEVKLDPSLVSDAADDAEARQILVAVLRIARKLKLDVVVEGVERQAQADLLKKLGCTKAQGFHLGKPRPACDWLADATYGPDGSAAA